MTTIILQRMLRAQHQGNFSRMTKPGKALLIWGNKTKPKAVTRGKRNRIIVRLFRSWSSVEECSPSPDRHRLGLIPAPHTHTGRQPQKTAFEEGECTCQNHRKTLFAGEAEVREAWLNPVSRSLPYGISQRTASDKTKTSIHRGECISPGGQTRPVKEERLQPRQGSLTMSVGAWS